MTAPAAPWRFVFDRRDSLPPLAWMARVHDGRVTVTCGTSVQTTDGGFFEGTWSGPPGIQAVARQETVFGSGMVLDGRELVIVPPSHLLEALYYTHDRDGTLVVANSFVAMLVATDRELDPTVPYPLLFGLSNRGITRATVDVPTTTDPITVHYFENLRVNRDASVALRPKPRGAPFADFANYRDRLVAATRSAFDNAPEYLPTVAMSSGYDSTAAGAVAAAAGCRTAVCFATGVPWVGHSGADDSPHVAAHALGISVETFDRMAYQRSDDAPEAEFLATGYSGEDVVYRSMDAALSRRIVVTGYWGGAAWRRHARPNLSRLDLSGASLGEFRLRLDWIHLPLPYIGGLQQHTIAALRRSEDMRAYSVGGEYDEPLARRLAEDAGVPRGSFAVGKRAASQRLHTFGLAAMSASGRASFESFAGPALATLPRAKARQIRRRHRAVIRLATALRATHLVAGLLERRANSVHFEPVLGTLLLRWAVGLIRPRYADLAASAHDHAESRTTAGEQVSSVAS